MFLKDDLGIQLSGEVTDTRYPHHRQVPRGEPRNHKIFLPEQNRDQPWASTD